MNPVLISIGELLVEIMREGIDLPHSKVGERYLGPFPSGAPAIFIDSAARMGAPFGISTGHIGVIGNDDFGNSILEKLKTDGVDTSQIRFTNLSTGIAFNQYNSDGSRKFIFAPGAARETSPKDVNRDYFENVKALHITGSALAISENSRKACYTAVKYAKQANPNICISFDPNLRVEMLDIDTILQISKPILEETKILLPSGEEAEMLAGTKDPIEACQDLLDKGPEYIFLKQGKLGCKIFTQENRNGLSVPSFEVREVDPTGAGDSFGGAFIVGFLLGWKLKKIAKFSNAVGALKASHFGPMSNTTYEEVIKFISNN